MTFLLLMVSFTFGGDQPSTVYIDAPNNSYSLSMAEGLSLTHRREVTKCSR